jgi:hypothetical protein
MVLNQQTVGNIGLHYVCYRLSRFGWNVMPTTRNAKGEKNGKISFWLQPRDYEIEEFREKWARIGSRLSNVESVS